MQLELLKSKIHRATVTDANLNYEGSITIARDLMDAAHILPYEKVGHPRAERRRKPQRQH